ncbi:CidA/LrgA family protein [Desulfovibrio aminophilus]|nr:CidA/LrgA family protein [Desulfovibrio aminophilus]MCM0754535.1 CidA/LrgA family protein [Desulfovibrio aminophilus]
MFLRKLLLSFRLAVRHSRLLQIGLLAGFWALGELIARAARLPIPGGVLGLVLVLLLLVTGRLHAASLRRGADWLLAEMLLFFIPAVPAVLDHREFLGVLGLKLLAAVLAGTLLVMGGTALTVDLCCRLVRHDGR